MAEDANQSEVLPVEGANTLDSNKDFLRGEETKYVLLPKRVFFYAIVIFDVAEHISLLYRKFSQRCFCMRYHFQKKRKCFFAKEMKDAGRKTL